MWAVYKKELRTYLQSPSTYVVVALLMLILGMIFTDILSYFSLMSEQSQQMGMFGQQAQAPNVDRDLIQQVFMLMSSLILFTIPMLSMRLVAEEKGRGTFELLVTCPIGDWAILLGKYFALVTVGALMIALSAIFPVIVWWLGGSTNAIQPVSPDWAIVASCWLGLLLIFAAYASFGVMASAFTENQVTAAIITLIGLLLWNVVGAFSFEGYPKVREVLEELSAQAHTQNFLNGVLTLKDLLYYVLASFLFLFVASKTLDARRWRV